MFKVLSTLHLELLTLNMQLLSYLVIHFMHALTTYTLYVTLFCMVINIIFGKLKLISLVWIYQLQKRNEPTMGISVIICTRNDLKNLQHHLPSLLAQDYPLFEVVVVDDASTDDTYSYLQNLSKENPHLKTVRLEKKTRAGKKEALQLGIEKSTYPFILLTDADCAPNSNHWIRSQAALANEKETVVLGYGAHQKEKGFLNTFIRFDTSSIAIQYMSRALWKYPYMGVGRNMGYSKDLSVSLATIDQTIASGDDDLFLQAITKRASFMVNVDKQSFTTSKAKQSWKTWLDQKGRHTTTAPHYSWSTQLWLLFKWLISASIYLGIIILLLTGQPAAGATLFLANALSIALFNGLWFRKLGENDLILLAPLLDFIYTFVQPIFVVKSWGRKKTEWN